MCLCFDVVFFSFFWCFFLSLYVVTLFLVSLFFCVFFVFIGFFLKKKSSLQLFFSCVSY